MTVNKGVDVGGTVGVTEWRVIADPDGRGRAESWQGGLPEESVAAAVPGYAQQSVVRESALYWYEGVIDLSEHAPGARRVHFESVDYSCDVWWNGDFLGSHEGAEEPFAFDLPDSAQGAAGRLTVLVYVPDAGGSAGPPLDEVPHRNRGIPFSPGQSWTLGGITGAVSIRPRSAIELVRIRVDADTETQIASVDVELDSANPESVSVGVELTLGRAGEDVLRPILSDVVDIPPGPSTRRFSFPIDGLERWDLDSPRRHRLSIRIADGERTVLQTATLFGIRDFRVSPDGFVLNGRPIVLKMTHTTNDFPLAWRHRRSLDALRQDLLRLKLLGFTMIRFIWGDARPEQLELCDEIGLLVYCESHAAWLVGPGRPLPSETVDRALERFLDSIGSVIRRFGNHPSIVIWGLLNECVDPLAVRAVAEMLPAVRAIDDSRVMVLSSGRFDHDLGTASLSNPRSPDWDVYLGEEAPGRPTARPGGWTNGWPPRPGEPMGTENGFGYTHVYPRVPHRREDIAVLRRGGPATSGNVFMGEYGIGSAVHLWDVVAEFELEAERTAAVTTWDFALYRELLERYLDDYRRWGLETLYGHPGDFFDASAARMAGERVRGLSAVTSNPRLIGFGLTGAFDQVMCGEGLTTTFRRSKPGAHEALTAMLAPTRLLLFTDRTAVDEGEEVVVEVHLVDEHVIGAGAHPIHLQVVADTGEVVTLDPIMIELPATRRGAAHGSARVSLPRLHPGSHRVRVRLAGNGVAASVPLELAVMDRPDPSARYSVEQVGATEQTRAWLTSAGIDAAAHDAESPEVPVLVWITPGSEGRSLLGRARSMAQSGRDVFVCVSPGELPSEDSWDGDALISFPSVISWLYLRDDWVKAHPVFDGLPGIRDGLFDFGMWATLLPDWLISIDATADEVISGGIKASQGYESGALLVDQRVGSGRIIYTTLALHGDQTESPIASALMRNIARVLSDDQTHPAGRTR